MHRPSAGLLPAIIVGLNLVAIATGVAIRRGRYWRLCINLVAIAIFLYLTALPNPIAMFYVALDVVVFYALLAAPSVVRLDTGSASPRRR